MASISIALKGPGPLGPSSIVEFSTKCDNEDFLEDLAAALCLSEASQLNTVSLTSLGKVHGHVAVPKKLRKLVDGEAEGPELGLDVAEGEL